MSASSPSPELDPFVGIPLEHHFVPRPWGLQHVVAAGLQGGETVVLVHGWPQHWFAWRHVIAALAPHGRVLAPDLRSFGWSASLTNEDATIPGLAADIVAVLDHFDLPSAHLAAHDWGGWIGFRAILDHPGRFRGYTAMSIVPPWLDARQMLRHLFGWLYVVPMGIVGDHVARRAPITRFLIEHSTTVPFWCDEAGRVAVQSYLDRVARPASAGMTRRLYSTLLRHELPEALGARPPRLQVPTTLLVGERETISRPQLYWGRTYPGEIRVVTVARARHWLAEEQPAAVIANLRRRLTTPSPE